MMGGASEPRPSAPPRLLAYRPWRGRLGGAWRGTWAIARTALGLLLRRRLFWGLYALSLLIFLSFFFGQYLMLWGEQQVGEQAVKIGAFSVEPAKLIQELRDRLKFNGSGEMFRNFIAYEASLVMAVLALAGAVLIGNDFRAGSMPFYLAKPVRRWHYLTGKLMAVAVFVSMMTLWPALVLYAQYGLLTEWDYFWDHAGLGVGLVLYGTLLTFVLSLMAVAAAAWLRRTVPLVMFWATVFVFGNRMSDLLVDRLRLDPHWRLLDLWNNLYLVGTRCLELDGARLDYVWRGKYAEFGKQVWRCLNGQAAILDRLPLRPEPQPPLWSAALVLACVSVLCLIYLHRRIRAVEIVA